MLVCRPIPAPHIEYLPQAIGNFSVLCNITADVTSAVQKLKPRRRPDGRTFYQFDFKVILLFGLTELRAQLKWSENVSQLSICTTFAR